MSIDLKNEKYHVIENFLDEEIYNTLSKIADRGSYTPGWKSSKKTDPHGHWNINFAKAFAGGANLADITYSLPDNLKVAWNSIQEKYSLQDTKLLRCYINAHTYGVDGYTHKDSHRDDEWTIVIYLIDNWNIDWAGETIVVDDGEIVKSVIPKRNRALIFPGNNIHAARAVSRTCFSLRRTLMFKFRARRCDDFERLSEFLVSKGANSLHSIFGTNAFTKCVLREDDFAELSQEFGDKAASLAKLFSTIHRPKTLENPEMLSDAEAVVKLRDETTMTIPRYAFDELRVMEAANLYDQKSLKEDKYPILCGIWGTSNKKNDVEDEFE